MRNCLGKKDVMKMKEEDRNWDFGITIK